VPYKTEGPYFVNLDGPATPSRTTPIPRDSSRPVDGGRPAPPRPKRRKRRIRIRPGWTLALALLTWIGWAYTTPGGPSARIRGWIDDTRGVVAEATANPDLIRTARYFNGLYKTQGSYPNLPKSAVESSPGFGLSDTLLYCGPRAIVLQSLSPGGSVSRLLLDGEDLGTVPKARACPRNLSRPEPWKLPQK
jgi:hypothetical protein